MTGLGEIKRDRSCNRRWLLRHGALALSFILALGPARAVERVGSVEDVTGEAFAELESVRRMLSLPPTPWQVFGAGLKCSESEGRAYCGGQMARARWKAGLGRLGSR